MMKEGDGLRFCVQLTLFSQRCTGSKDVPFTSLLVNCAEIVTQNHIVEPNQHVLTSVDPILMDRGHILISTVGDVLTMSAPIIVMFLEIIVVLELFSAISSTCMVYV
jgi:hypothetical protein